MNTLPLYKDWRASLTAMLFCAFGGLGGLALGWLTPLVGLSFFALSGLFAIQCIILGQILVENDDRHGWFSTYAGALLLGALVSTFLVYLG